MLLLSGGFAPGLAGDLSGGDVQAIPDVDRRDRQEQRRQRLLVVVPRRFVPDRVGDALAPIGNPRERLGERQRRPLGIVEVRRIPPRRDREEPLVRFAVLPGQLLVHVQADAAAVDLARAQVHEAERLRRYASLLRHRAQGAHGLQGLREDQDGVAHPCMHDSSPCHINEVTFVIIRVRYRCRTLFTHDGPGREDVTVTERERLAEPFEENRAHLRAVAYRMLGSMPEAEDAAYEAWLRLNRTDTSAVENLRGWLTTVVARVCLDMLRTRRSRREESLDAHAPEPIASRADGTDPEREALMADSVGLALLVVLDTLEPPERLAFVLHDMFAVPFDEIASIVGRSPAAARQLASRARRRVRGGAASPSADVNAQRAVVDAFLAAVRAGDVEALVAVLDPDVVVRADAVSVGAGGSREVRGAREWAKGAIAAARGARAARAALVNGEVGVVVAPRGRLFRVLRLTFAGGKIAGVDVVGDPARLAELDLAVL